MKTTHWAWRVPCLQTCGWRGLLDLEATAVNADILYGNRTGVGGALLEDTKCYLFGVQFKAPHFRHGPDTTGKGLGNRRSHDLASNWLLNISKLVTMRTGAQAHSTTHIKARADGFVHVHAQLCVRYMTTNITS